MGRGTGGKIEKKTSCDNGSMNICFMSPKLVFTSYCCYYISSGASSQQRNLKRKGNIKEPNMFNLKTDINFNIGHKKVHLLGECFIADSILLLLTLVESFANQRLLKYNYGLSTAISDYI